MLINTKMGCGQRVLYRHRWLLSLAPVPQPWWAGRFSGWSILWAPVQGSRPLQRAPLHSYGNLPKCIIGEYLSNLTLHKYNLESILKCRFPGSLRSFWSSSSEVAPESLHFYQTNRQCGSRISLNSNDKDPFSKPQAAWDTRSISKAQRGSPKPLGHTAKINGRRRLAILRVKCTILSTS